MQDDITSVHPSSGLGGGVRSTFSLPGARYKLLPYVGVAAQVGKVFAFFLTADRLFLTALALTDIIVINIVRSFTSSADDMGKMVGSQRTSSNGSCMHETCMDQGYD